MIHEFRNPIPVVVEGNKEGYAIYVTYSGTFENDTWCVVHCTGGNVRHYRTDQIRIHRSGTLGISKKESFSELDSPANPNRPNDPTDSYT